MGSYDWVYDNPEMLSDCMRECLGGCTEFNINHCYSCEFYMYDCEVLDMFDKYYPYDL